MQPHSQSPLRSVINWLNLSLFNTPHAGYFFEYLVESIDPAWSVVECKARVLEVIEETADTKTWVLQPSRRWKGFKAGQHAQITVTKNGARQTRTFTLSSSPEQWKNKGTVTITVKKVADGRITSWMHEHLQPSNVITLSPAKGEFILGNHVNSNIGYIAAGSGITPIMSQLRWLTGKGIRNKAELLYFANTQKDFIFGEELKAMNDAHPTINAHFIASYDKKANKGELPQKPISAEHIQALLKTNPKHIYLCGPIPFRDITKTLLAEAGFDLAFVYEEAFGLPPVKVVEGEPVTISFRNSHSSTTVDPSDSLLNIAEKAGLTPKSGCRMGVCYSCKCTKYSGQVKNIITGKLSSSDEEEIQICISVPVSNVELEL